MTCAYWGGYMEDMPNCKIRTHAFLLSHLPLLHPLGLTSNFRWLVVMVTARVWGLFALFLLSSLKPCHYPYSTGPRVYWFVWLWLYLSVRLLVSLSLPFFLTAVFFSSLVDLCTTPSAPDHLQHLPLCLMHSWSTTYICAHFALHPFPSNDYIIIKHLDLDKHTHTHTQPLHLY